MNHQWDESLQHVREESLPDFLPTLLQICPQRGSNHSYVGLDSPEHQAFMSVGRKSAETMYVNHTYSISAEHNSQGTGLPCREAGQTEIGVPSKPMELRVS